MDTIEIEKMFREYKKIRISERRSYFTKEGVVTEILFNTGDLFTYLNNELHSVNGNPSVDIKDGNKYFHQNGELLLNNL
jgi:hypothetical protein